MHGPPGATLSDLTAPDQIAVLPAKIPHIKPRLKVAEGDAVKIGSLLFEDKRNSAYRFLSPAGGRVNRVDFGPRRAIEAIVIDREHPDEPYQAFPVIAESQLAIIPREELVDHICQGGLWWTLRQLPFRDLCPLDTIPPLIIVSLDAREPFQPSPMIYLQDRIDLLKYGIQVLEKLSQNRVAVIADPNQKELLQDCRSILTHTVSGHYPAGDPGTVLYHIKQSSEENRAWFMNGQDLILMSQLLSQGRYPVERIVSVAGSAAPVQQHYRTRLGVPTAHLVDLKGIEDHTRFIVGGLFRGHISGPDGFMGLYETALNLVPEGAEAEFLSLFKPGMVKPSYSRAFASKLEKGPLHYNCNLNGSLRPCIACMHCADICPVDILPELMYKAILTEELEEALELGLLDCVECGLCSYVCPSKIELSQTLIAAKANYAKEVGTEN